MEANAMGNNAKETTVGDVMERDAYRIASTATLGDVTAKLSELNVSSLPVVDDQNRVVGFISDGDIMRAIAAHKSRTLFSGGVDSMLFYDDETLEQKALALKSRNVMELAARKVLCATPDQSVGRAAETLSKRKIKKMPVIDEEGHLIGVIRRGCITRLLFDMLFHEGTDSKTNA